MNIPKCYSIIMLLLAAFATIALQAVTIVDTGLVTNPPTATANLINPKGVSLTAATGSTAESTIESISGLHVIQDFSTSLAGGDNVFAFTDSSLPDIEISFSGGVMTTTGTSLSNSSFLTSESSSMRIQGDRTGTFAMTIDFGVWNGSSFSSSGATVDAAAFTLFGNGGEFVSFNVDYLDESNSVITTQTSSGTNAYFGLDSSTPIGAIVITFNPYSSNDGPLGFDDLAFVPNSGDTQAPSVPTGLSSSNITTTSVDLSWIASTDNVGVTEYTVYVDGSSVGTSSGTSKQITGLSPSTTYSLTVSANDVAENESAQSSAEVVTTSSLGGTPIEVIVDNLDAEFDGTWDASTWAADYYGSNYQFNVAGTGADKVRWRPDLVAGDYDVYIWLPDGASSRPDDAPFTVYDASGSTTYLVDERGPGGAWVLLGTHTFNSGTSGYVELTDDASNTHVIADAVRFDPTITSNQVAAPVFNPGGGSYTSAQNVSMSTATVGASIRYTTDGSNPTSTTGTLYSSAITVSTTTTLKAIAYKSGMTDSNVSMASYSIGGGGGPLYGARGAWPSDTPAEGATATATFSNLDDLKVALRTANPGDVFHLTSFNLTSSYEMKDTTARDNMASFGPSDLNVLVRPAPGAEVDLQAGLEVFIPNVTWAYFELNSFFAFRLWSDHSRLARIQMGPSAKITVTASSYHEFVECLKPVRGEDGDTMQVTSQVISGVLQATPRDILWDSCWLEGNTVVSAGQHSDTIQWLCADGKMTFRNCYIGPAGNNATFQFNLTHQPSGLDYALFDLDTCFMGGAEIYGNGNVLGAFHTPAIIRNVEYPHLKSRGDPFVLPAVVEDCRIQASDINIDSDLGGGLMSSLYPDNEYGATITWPTFVEPSWWN